MAHDTLADRWTRLEPHIEVFGPDDATARPTVLLFHGCGGVRDHIRMYAKAAAEAGYRAFVIDSYAPRGWNRLFGLAFVCSGAIFRGAERSGDVLAAIWGVSQRSDVLAGELALAGWSHGSWAIMDLMTLHLTRSGEALLHDPDPKALEGVKGLYLAYPYGGVGALSRVRPWVRHAKTLGVIAERDHITRVADAELLYRTAERAGAQVEIWRADGTHAFDESGTNFPMRYDPELAARSVERFTGHLHATLARA